jgi:hypothetical protein
MTSNQINIGDLIVESWEHIKALNHPNSIVHSRVSGVFVTYNVSKYRDQPMPNWLRELISNKKTEKDNVAKILKHMNEIKDNLDKVVVSRMEFGRPFKAPSNKCNKRIFIVTDTVTMESDVTDRHTVKPVFRTLLVLRDQNMDPHLALSDEVCIGKIKDAHLKCRFTTLLKPTKKVESQC